MVCVCGYVFSLCISGCRCLRCVDVESDDVSGSCFHRGCPRLWFEYFWLIMCVCQCSNDEFSVCVSVCLSCMS